MTEQKPSDSVTSAKERRAKIREEAAQIEQDQAGAAEKQREHQAIMDAIARQDETKNVGIVAVGETREHLLQRIRDMRQEGAPVPEPEVFRTPGQMQELTAEQEAGRAAVAKAEREQNMHRERLQQEAMADRERTGHMEAVYNPNPSQQQVYPTNKR